MTQDKQKTELDLRIEAINNSLAQIEESEILSDEDKKTAREIAQLARRRVINDVFTNSITPNKYRWREEKTSPMDFWNAYHTTCSLDYNPQDYK